MQFDLKKIIRYAGREEEDKQVAHGQAVAFAEGRVASFKGSCIRGARRNTFYMLVG